MTRYLISAFFLVLATACGDDLMTESAASTSDDIAGVPDRTISVVDIDEVYFDTFDGGSIALGDATVDDIVGLLDRIPPIDAPRYIEPSEDDWLGDDDLVLGYIDASGQPYAYPHKILNFHEIVNDTLATVPVLISYCPLCNSGVVFDRRLDDLRHDGALTFGNSSALYDNDLVMVDRETNTYWWQVPGRGIVGTLSGAELTVLPSTTTTWGQWLIDEPETLVLSRDLGFRRDYERDPFVGYADRVNAGNTPFPVDDRALRDGRLAPATQVIAIEVGDDAAAVPVAELVRELALTVGGVEHIIEPDGSGGARVYATTGDGSRVPAASRSTFWFAYVASFPEARVVLP